MDGFIFRMPTKQQQITRKTNEKEMRIETKRDISEKKHTEHQQQTNRPNYNVVDLTYIIFVDIISVLYC